VRLLLDTGVLGELRRELLRIRAVASLARLDDLAGELIYAPITTATWRRAAGLWASARRVGVVTAPPAALDGDVLVAAQAIEQNAVVVTTNAKHFEALATTAVEWDAVPLP
jgi:predicted nucleic acid-binding protein